MSWREGWIGTGAGRVLLPMVAAQEEDLGNRGGKDLENKDGGGKRERWIYTKIKAEGISYLIPH